MTTFVALPDLHSRYNDLYKMIDILASVDVVLLAGDMTNGKFGHLKKLLETIKPYNTTIYSVCGNMDKKEMETWLDEQNLSIHRTHVIVDEVAILGCGGALPFYGSYVFSEDELAAFLDDSVQGVPDDVPKILVCHQPPYGILDTPSRNPDKHAGSQSVRAFIERVQPLVCFTGHMHSSTGIETIGQTQIINPGPLWQSKQYAYAEIENGTLINLDIRRL